MELAAKYVYEVYRKKSFSLAAEALFISQPALSAMTAKLERELGFQLFERTRGSAVKLTPRGRIYMDMLEDIRASEEVMKKRLEQYGGASSERLRIGAMMHMAQLLLPEAIRCFQSRYSDVLINLNMGNVGPHGVLHDKLEAGMLDVLLSYRTEERFESRPLLTERYLIAMRRDLPGASALQPYALTREQILTHQYTDAEAVSDLSLFDTVPFITDGDVSSRSTLSSILRSHYSLSTISISDSRNVGMYYKLVGEGMGAILTSDVNLFDPLFEGQDLIYLIPESPKFYRTLYVLWRKGENLSDAAQYMIEVLTEYCRKFSAVTLPSPDAASKG